MKLMLQALLIPMLCMIFAAVAFAQMNNEGKIFRLYEGITAYIDNSNGDDFTVSLDLRDLNLLANGPREVLFKVYDPDGKPVVREIIPDDGVASGNFLDRIGGWDHEIQYYADLYAKGTTPSFRWSAWSNPARLQTIVKRTFKREITGGKKGIYRIVIAGTPDNYVTLNLSPALRYGVAGHPTWNHGHGDLFKTSYVYIPQGTNGLFFAIAEPDMPRTRHFILTAPDGKVLFNGVASGGYTSSAVGTAWQTATIGFSQPGLYDGKLLKLEVSSGPNDYLVKITLQQPKEGAFNEYVGMGSMAVFAPDEKTAMAIKGGTTVVDNLVFWHPFQIRFYNWVMSHKLDANDKEKELRKNLFILLDAFRMLETSDGRGSASWTNWAYSMGYYGCRIWRTSWLLMKDQEVPQDVKDIIREGLIMAGDRLSFATSQERVNGNAFAQIAPELWYCSQATGDPMQKERFEVFWDRWKNEGWGPGCGLSKSGDAQESFAHDMHYGSYLMDNWRGITWVHTSILEDAKDDPRFKQVIDRYRELYTYLYCRDSDGRPVAANPWSSRTQQSSHLNEENWNLDCHSWKGEPGPDFNVSVNGGDEWFAARRKQYYILTFHGRLTPEWLSQTFEGQVGFGGGAICQLTIPGKGPVLASVLNGAYGEGMDHSNWRNFHINSIVGELWDGRPIVSGISEHDDAKLNGNTVTSSGEVRNTHLKVTRSYTYNPDSIDCTAKLNESVYADVLAIWSHARNWSEVRQAYEMIPFMPTDASGVPTILTLRDAAGKDLGTISATPTEASVVHIDRNGFGVDIQLDKPAKVQLGANKTVLIQLVEPLESTAGKFHPASEAAIHYRLVPFVTK